VEETVEEMNKQGIPCDVIAYNMLIDLCAQKGSFLNLRNEIFIVYKEI
jgi:hypothetical protein